MDHKDFISAVDQDRVVKAICTAEEMTSGEIRVHIQPKAHGEIRTVAERTFERLGMTKTDLRNGVLLFVASEEQRFVILGDQGIDDKVPAGFWDEIAAKLTIRFKHGEFTDGIVEAIHSAGEELRHYFPRSHADINELANEINIDH
jgi:uncharacterized membrane protein